MLIPPGDVDAAVEACRRVASDPALRAELVDAGLECLKRYSLDSEAGRVAALLAGATSATPTGASSHERHPATELGMGRAARERNTVDSHGDPALAEVLRDSGYSVGGEHSGTPGPQRRHRRGALRHGGPARRGRRGRAVAALGEGGVVSIAVAGGRVAPPKAVPAPLRAAQLLLQPIETLRALAGARRVERVAEGRGAAQHAAGHRRPLPQPLRAGPRGLAKRLRTPVGYVLTGSRGPQPASLLQAVLGRGGGANGVSLQRRSTTVFESGKVVMDLRGDDCREYFMRLAAGPALGPLNAAIVAVHAVAAAEPRPRRARPGRGAPRPRHGGPASLLPRAERHRDPPVAHDERLWAQCLDFLVELFPLDLSGSRCPRSGASPQQAARMHGYIDAASAAWSRW